MYDPFFRIHLTFFLFLVHFFVACWTASYTFCSIGHMDCTYFITSNFNSGRAFYLNLNLLQCLICHLVYSRFSRNITKNNTWWQTKGSRNSWPVLGREGSYHRLSRLCSQNAFHPTPQLLLLDIRGNETKLTTGQRVVGTGSSLLLIYDC